MFKHINCNFITERNLYGSSIIGLGRGSFYLRNFPIMVQVIGTVFVILLQHKHLKQNEI